jgi:archaellum component FlaD/FlaE
MDTLRDFDKLLEEAGRPTEEEVLDYYESVGLCLEQRAAAGAKLQQELDRVSEGEPPME